MEKYDCAIIPAAGKGSRFYELGKAYPKCVLPYEYKPIITHIVEKAIKKTDKVYIAVETENQYEEIWKCVYQFPQVEMVIIGNKYKIGPAGSIADACEKALEVGHEKALVLLSDAIPSFIPQPWPQYENVVYTSNVDDYARWCMVEGKVNPIFHDKVSARPPTTQAANGIYQISTRLFIDHTPKEGDGESQLSDVFKKSESVLATDYVGDILDFGTLEEYLVNKNIPKSRSFNKIYTVEYPNNKHRIVKSSTNWNDVFKQATFIKNLPEQMATYFPTIHEIDMVGGRYSMDMIKAQNLREIALFTDNSYQTWVDIFEQVRDFMALCEDYYIEGNQFAKELVAKNNKRLETVFEVVRGISPQRRFYAQEFIRELNKRLLLENFQESLFHGDLHFANMFYDYSDRSLMLVDPRGDVAGATLYDRAKLLHSVIGRYDYIETGLYTKDQFYDKGKGNIIKAYVDVFGQPTELEVMLTASLFLTMIPLHSDSPERCEALFVEFERLSKGLK